MQACYAEDATFSDSVFKNLNSQEVKSMWEMLCKRGKDFSLEYKDVKVDGDKGSAIWDASYTFSSTGNHVDNHIQASFVFRDGLIVKHVDDFDFHTWAGQALGLTGKLLGWTGYLQKKVSAKGKAGLLEFMKK